MKTIRIARQKSFAGSFIPFYAVFDADETTLKKDFKAKSLQGYKLAPIKNGQMISIETDGREHSLIILANTSTGVVISNSCSIGADDDAHFQVTNKYSFMRGSNLLLKQI